MRDLDYVHFSSGPRSEPVRAISSGPRSEPVREIAEFTVDPGKSRCVLAIERVFAVDPGLRRCECRRHEERCRLTYGAFTADMKRRCRLTSAHLQHVAGVLGFT